jgi:hypothetical protein
VSATGPNGSASAHYYYAWKVIFTLTNTSSTTYQLEVQRTVVGELYAAGATTLNGNAQVNLTDIAWQDETGFANLTSSGSVLTIGPNATLVPAVALVNENAWGSGNITAVLTASWTGASGPASGEVYASLAASVNAYAMFATPLGLFPLQPYQGESWASSAAFTAGGEYAVSFHVYARVPWTSAVYSGTGSPIGVGGYGTVTVSGSDLMTYPFPNGETANVILLTWTGTGWGFESHEGVLLIPTQGDLFNNGSVNASGAKDVPGTQNFGTSELDVGSAGNIIASESQYASSSIFGNTPVSSARAQRVSDGSPDVGTLQGLPMSVSAAESWCLVNCPGSPTKSGAGGVIAVLLIAVVAVVAIVAVAKWTGRKRGPSPSAMPPGQNGYATARTAVPMTSPQIPPPPPPPPPSEGTKDPVGFYWQGVLPPAPRAI